MAHDAPFRTGNARAIDPSGANKARVGAFNERLVLSLIRRHGALAKSEIARHAGLSAQTVSLVVRRLEEQGLILRGDPQRGQVGQPRVPLSLNPDGGFAFGLKIGRRSMELVLMDLAGGQRGQHRMAYPYPRAEAILDFVTRTIAEMTMALAPDARDRVAGIGVAMPFELWNWAGHVGMAAEDMAAWRSVDFGDELAKTVGIPVFVENDGTAACSAELIFGQGVDASEFVYFFVGTFIGGGIVLNDAVYPGRSGNAGALGSLPIAPGSQLIDMASLHVLEARLRAAGIDPGLLWLGTEDWSGFDDLLAEWIAQTADYLAAAVISAASIVDFPVAVIDGALPGSVRARLVAATQAALSGQNSSGLILPQVVEGSIGAGARALGGASLPLFARYFLDRNQHFTAAAAQ